MKNKLSTILVFAASAIAAQATIYRAGLKGGFINSYDGNNYTTVSIADIGVFASVEAGSVKASSNSNKTYPPIWADNRTWRYHGQMYFDGGTYYFAESVDDAVWVTVDGTQILKDGTWNNVGVSSAVAPSAGWHDVEIRFGNGTGGAGVPYDTTKDANGKLCGFGVASYATAPGSKPTAMSAFTFAENTAGNVWMRCVEEGSYLTLNSVEQTSTGYRFNITSSAPSPATVIVYAGDAAGAADSATGWDYDSGAVSFAANETKDVDVDGTFTVAPHFVMNLSGVGTTLEEGIGVDFWEWSAIQQCTMAPTVAATLSAVTGTSGTFGVTLGYDKVVVGMTPPAITLKAYYGSADAGATATGWDSEEDFGSANAAGAQTCALTGLTEGAAYYVRFAAKTADSDWIWTDALAFSTAGPSLANWPDSVYENDLQAKSFTVTRPAAASAEALTVNLSYSGATAKVAGLPASVEFPAGVSEVVVSFTLVDNAVADGDANLVVQIVPDAAYPVGNPVSATIVVVDDEALVSTECVWTGGGDGENWNDPDNWYPRVPTIVDVAKFTSVGLTANRSIVISGTAAVKELLIETTTAFTLTNAPAGGTLELGAITRADVEGTEGNHTLAVPTFLYAGSETNCIWNIAGSGALVIRTDFTKSAGTYVFKTGAGTVEMRYKNSTFTGPWIIWAGTILCPEDQGNTFKGTTTIGGGETPAKLQQSKKNSIAGKTPLYIYANGTFDSVDIDNGRVEAIYVHEGGVAKIGSYFYTLTADFWGGTYNGGTTYNSKNITAHASDIVATLNATWRLDAYGDYSVTTERGTAPIDLLITKELREGASGKNLKKAGAGIVKSTANMGNLKNHIQINAGTWYVDNPGEYGLGIQETTVATGAKIGGTGCVGMKDVKSYATLALSDGSESKYATLSPGTIDAATGGHVYGTFTGGRESAHNKVTLGNWTHLEIGVGPKDSATKLSPFDKLFVYGNLEIGSNCTLDLVSKMAGRMQLAPGTYTIVEADSIVGTFATVLKPSAAWPVVYETETVDGNEVVRRITLTVPPPETVMILR